MFTRQNPFQPASRVGTHYHPSCSQSLSKKKKKTVCIKVNIIYIARHIWFSVCFPKSSQACLSLFCSGFESCAFKPATQSTITHSSESRESTAVWEIWPPFSRHRWTTCFCRVLAIHWLWIFSSQPHKLIWLGDTQRLCESKTIHSFLRARSWAGFSAGKVCFQFSIKRCNM